MIEDILTDSIIAELDVVIRHLEIMSLKKILEIDKYVNIVIFNLTRGSIELCLERCSMLVNFLSFVGEQRTSKKK